MSALLINNNLPIVTSILTNADITHSGTELKTIFEYYPWWNMISPYCDVLPIEIMYLSISILTGVPYHIKHTPVSR